MADKDAGARLKSLGESAADFKVDSNIPIRRYFNSGREMTKMADIYFSEDNLEAAYFLYLKFITLFIEKIKLHRDWGQVLPQEKKRAVSEVKTVMVKTESLKVVLRERFSAEHRQWEEEEKERREQQERLLTMERERLAREERERQELAASIEADRQVALWHQAQMDQEDRLVRGTGSQQQVKLSDFGSVVQDPGKPDYGGVMPDPGKPVYNPADYSDHSPPPQYSEAVPSAPAIDRGSKPGERASGESAISTGTVHSPPSSSKSSAAPAVNSMPSFDRSVKPSLGSGSSLRTVVVPQALIKQFLSIAASNSNKGLETLGTLGGKLAKNRLEVTHLVIPRQKGASDSCTMEGLEQVWEVHDKEDIIFLGWIHTHPAYSVYLSSVDMHNQYEWQHMLPEALAIVCSIKDNETGFLHLTEAGMSEIGSCSLSNFHPHSKEPPLFQAASHVQVDSDPDTKVVLKDLR